MIKSLHIVRHGKSSWDFEDISDIDRPLSPRGINNAYLMSKKLSERKVVPDLFLTSPANRALYTSIIFARILKFPYEKIKFDKPKLGKRKKSKGYKEPDWSLLDAPKKYDLT